MALLIAAYTLFYCFAFAATENPLDPLSDDFISLINSKQSSWRAGRNFGSNTPFSYLQGLMGAEKDPHIDQLPNMIHDPELIASLPENFDSREKWPNCPSLNEIRDQGSCGSCWAVSAVSAMTDRVCIYSNGTKQFHFSAEDLISCCEKCGGGCEGGVPSWAWQYWLDVGIVSGGPYYSSEGCRPYEVPPCEHHDVKGNRPNCSKHVDTPKCTDKCRAGYGVNYDHDKQKAKRIYRIIGEDNIRAELYTNGPVEAMYSVYPDFLHYKNNVYVHTAGGEAKGHAIKILGWGVEDGKKYWLCANSWNTDWGDKGFFKILRGENHCGIEEGIVAGEPDLGSLFQSSVKIVS